MGRVTSNNFQPAKNMIEEIQTEKSGSSAPSGRLHPLVVALVSLKRIRFGEPYWTHRLRWLYLPWKWAYKKSAHGGWFFLTLRTPLEMIVGVENLARWQNKRAARRRHNTEVSHPQPVVTQ